MPDPLVLPLDPVTLYVTALAMAGGIGVALVVAWVHNRHTDALLHWALAYLLSMGAQAWLVASLHHHDSAASYVPASALSLLALAQVHAGIRRFNGGIYPWAATVAAPFLWAGACLIMPTAMADSAVRTLVFSLLALSYGLAAMQELRRVHEGLTRWPLMLLLGGYVLFCVWRIAAIGLQWPALQPPTQMSNMAMLLTLAYCVASGFCFLSLTSDRTTAALRQEVHTDPLTGALSRRELLLRADAMLSRLALQGGNVSVLVLDLDHFKHINDRHGHPTGDRVLRAFAESISRDALRQRDLFGRLGGEEFAIVLHSAGRGAMNVAERIRDAIAALEIPTDDGRGIIRATTSIGLAAGKAARGDLALLIARADQALYRAKQNGRNRVERWLDELPDDTLPREYPHSETFEPEK